MLFSLVTVLRSVRSEKENLKIVWANNRFVLRFFKLFQTKGNLLAGHFAAL